MLVFTLAGPSLVYVRRAEAQLNLNNELQLKWGSQLGFCKKAEYGFPAKNCLRLG